MIKTLMDIAPTRGRLASDTQVAAITRVVALSPQRKVILEGLDRVISSSAFQPTKRGQAFLHYIVEHALAGELDHLKERCIGSALFGRPPDYDTGSDSIVRVTANEVRKRLASYYAQTLPEDPVKFELPIGSYIPEIHLEALNRRPVVLDSEVTTHPSPRGSRRLAVAAAGWCVAAILGLLLARSAITGAESAQSRALRVLPWVALFENGQSPRVIMADSAMGTLRLFEPFPASIEDYANRRFLSPPAGLRPEFLHAWSRIASAEFTSVADAHIASDYSPLAVAAGRNPVIRSARDFNLSDFHRGDNFILLGSHSSNPWAELFYDQMDFLMRFDPSTGNSIEVRHPRAGEPRVLVTSVSSGNTGEAYATLALVSGLDGRGRVLLAQGTNMEGTELAGALALNPERMATELRHCGIDPNNPAGRFEILLRLNTTAGSARSSAVVASRCRSGR